MGLKKKVQSKQSTGIWIPRCLTIAYLGRSDAHLITDFLISMQLGAKCVVGSPKANLTTSVKSLWS